jgi:CheY-like chemotaxis protein
MNATPDRRRGILLALDDPDASRGLLALLEAAGCRVDCVASGAAAVEAVRSNAYGLALMATELQGLDGLEASRRIRELSVDGGSIPIVAIGAGEDPDRQAACLDAGMDLCIAEISCHDQLPGLMESWLQDPATAPATLDMKVLERLASDTSPEVMPRLLATFRRETARRVAAVSRLWLAQDLHALRREAHSLKSSAGTFGATSLQQLARELELNCRDGETGPAGDLAAAIVAHWPRVVRALVQYPHERENKCSGNAQG